LSADQELEQPIRPRLALVLSLVAAPAFADVPTDAGEEDVSRHAGGMASESAYEARRAACTGWMLEAAYPSGLDETWCTAEFDLPSPFLIKCARAQRLGYESETQRQACRLMFLRAADNTGDGYILN